ncbi:TetR family transcriptional regulator [[Bacillus] enclensis]|jgi:AcrR family transcriptional regulator|uniref:Transcriptional regulator, TetR family n=1 Tax=[Bacillus] enclensis TaxID=1402860 RepID=A0A0V8HGK9_9BACI|nr:TetR/AcrR family transcriptional regulator C-terminal domain-containing protein [[Bacillus] enclensis]KSU61731.1 TetR family transcriptional regulator [[Bacillus] enclensis]OAT85949.1 TetR family transcriptional regulator [Bacillus sp. MKU004]SCC14481.1 transcriptional regulator, TetR family [[Bacillus] enclensis]
MDKQSKQTDPRVLRTRQLLKEAFVDLLQEMDIEKLSVNRLAERATINRVTFYLHYKDISDMLDKMADEVIEDMSNVLGEPEADKSSGDEENIKMLERFLEHIAENAKFYKTILVSRGLPHFKERLLSFFTEWLVQRIDSRGSDSFVRQAGIEKEIFLWYDAAAVMGTVEAWLRNDMPYTPAYLARQFYLIHKRGFEDGE